MTPGVPLRIVFPEGDDPRIREAAEFLSAQGFADPILLTGSDDLLTAYQLVQDETAVALIAFSAPAPTTEPSFFLLERGDPENRPERLILTDTSSIQSLDPEKLLAVQPRLAVFPASDPAVAQIRAAHPIWLIGDSSALDDINVLVAADSTTRLALLTSLKQFAGFRAYGPISPSPVLSATLAPDATTADIITTTECLAKLA